MSDRTEALPVYDSSQRGLPALEELRELLRYRNLVIQTVRRNIVVRYKRSALGIAWTMLNPLGTTIILTFVFSRVFGGPASYAVYVLSGLICWTFFSQATSDSMNNLIWGGGLIKRIYVPRTVFAVSSVITGLVNIALAMVPLLVVMLVTGIYPTWSMLILPVPALILAMFALGVGLFLSAIAVFFVDVTDMYAILLTAWFYLSPVIYKPELLPEQYAWIVKLNPMYYLINLFRAPIYEGRVPSLEEFLVAGGIALVTLVIGWFVFAQKADEFAYRV
jgi:ABC-type polysaccharide/polyol phosphate export permease